MEKFYGKIGFAEMAESEPGVWDEVISEHYYYGDVVRNTRRIQNSGSINDNVDISNEISIVSDPYANNNFHSMRYVWYMGARWKVSTVNVQYPRLILSLGGIYNG